MKIEQAKELGIINGIGGDSKKGGVNLSLLFKNNIEQFKEYIPEKGIKLFNDIEVKSYFHDVDYYNGNTILEKIKADYIFSLEVISLLSWTTSFKRIIIFSLIFFTLLIYGNKYYNYGEKRYITLQLK